MMRRHLSGLGMTVILILALMIVGCNREEESIPSPNPNRDVYWTNPISLPDEWEQYGLGDPYVFKYNGTYYLYVSTRDTDAGIKVWSSSDLANWSYRGLCTEEAITTAAYAPEVKYWNGKFYLYTSPAGNGHYVLTSDSPTGPFTVATDNIGKSIDGSVFVDDDGQWYFYHAGPGGIEAAPMSDPLTFGTSIPTGADMGGWTEGPTVWKHDGRYYMTYTGNHVFSNAYRIDAATSQSPLNGFSGLVGNPILIRTEGPTVGLGHNSVVEGPDLDSEFIIYHNLEGPGIVGPLRHMDMDRVVWSGEKLFVLGPTSDKQPAPELPAFSDRFEREKLGSDWIKPSAGELTVKPGEGMLLNKEKASENDVNKVDVKRSQQGSGSPARIVTKSHSGEDYTAEFHVRLAEQAEGEERVGAVFSYSDEHNYGEVMLNARTNSLEVQIVSGGKAAAIQSAPLPAGYDMSKLHQLRVEKAGKRIVIYVDGMRKLELTAALGGGSVGYTAEGKAAAFGYIAFSNEVNGSSAGRAYKPLPGDVQAIHMEAGEGQGVLTTESDGENGEALLGLKAGKPLSYRVNVAKAGRYDIALRVRKAGDEAATLRLTTKQDSAAADFKVPQADKTGTWSTVIKRGVELKPGLQSWKLEMTEGQADLVSFSVHPYEEVPLAEDDFKDGNDFGWTRYEGIWSVGRGRLTASSEQPAKTIFGSHSWGDYVVEADLTRRDGTGQAGVLVRATEPANGMERNQNRDDFVKGYYVYSDGDTVSLVKHNYDTQELASVRYKTKADQSLHLQVRVIGTVIQVFAGESAAPLIRYEDKSANPFMNGGIGFKAVNETTRFERIKITPLP